MSKREWILSILRIVCIAAALYGALLIAGLLNPKTEPTSTPTVHNTVPTLKQAVLVNASYFAERAEEMGITREPLTVSGPIWIDGDTLRVFQDGAWGGPDGPGQWELWTFSDSSQIVFFVLDRTGAPSQAWLPGHDWIGD